MLKVIFVIPLCDRENLGILGLVSYLRSAGVPADVAYLHDYKALCRKIASSRKTLLGFHSLTVFHRYIVDLNRELKKDFPGRIFTVLGGPHPTFCPEAVEEPGVDAVCRGEGEGALLDLARALESAGDVANIQNIWVARQGKRHENSLRPLIEDLDALPLPVRDLSGGIVSVRLKRYSVITHRGCPFDCAYCFNHAYYRMYGAEKKVRRRSVGNVISEIVELKDRWGAQEIIFQDDTFITSQPWVAEFSQRYSDEVRLPFTCFVRPDLVTEDIARSLKRAGCVIINMGVESADDNSLRFILGRNMDSGKIMSAIRIIKENGIYLRTTNLAGIPGGSIGSDMATLDFNIRHGVDYARANVVAFYPGTDMFRIAREKGLLGDGFRETTRGGNRSLERKCKDPRESRRLENLACLFPVVARFPFLMRFLTTLIKLPLNPLYRMISTALLIYELYLRRIRPEEEPHFFVRAWKRRRVAGAILKLFTTTYKHAVGRFPAGGGPPVFLRHGVVFYYLSGIVRKFFGREDFILFCRQGEEAAFPRRAEEAASALRQWTVDDLPFCDKSIFAFSKNMFRRRIRGGDVGFLGQADGRVVYSSWISFGMRPENTAGFMKGILKKGMIPLGPADAYFYDARTDPLYRRKGWHTWGMRERLRCAEARGVSRVFTLVEKNNEGAIWTVRKFGFCPLKTIRVRRFFMFSRARCQGL